jgi:AMP-binding enzyme C-terminal domain
LASSTQVKDITSASGAVCVGYSDLVEAHVPLPQVIELAQIIGPTKPDLVDRIGPAEVKNALLEHPAVLECAVIGAPHREHGEIVKAFVVLRSAIIPNDKPVSDLQEQVKRVTAQTSIPALSSLLESFPKPRPGKFNARRAANARFTNGTAPIWRFILCHF